MKLDLNIYIYKNLKIYSKTKTLKCAFVWADGTGIHFSSTTDLILKQLNIPAKHMWRKQWSYMQVNKNWKLETVINWQAHYLHCPSWEIWKTEIFIR